MKRLPGFVSKPVRRASKPVEKSRFGGSDGLGSPSYDLFGHVLRQSLVPLAIMILCCRLCGLSALSAAEKRDSYQRSHVKAAFRESVAKASASTVKVLGDGKSVALGAIVDPDGYVLTKADLLAEGKLACQLSDGRKIDAELVGQDDKHDLALLKIEAKDLTPVAWRRGDPPPTGSWLATVGQGPQPLAIGIVGSEPHAVAQVRRGRDRGVLGISLDSPDSVPRVATVAKGSAAEKAGLKVGDLVKSIDGKATLSVSEVVRTVRRHPPGKTIKLVVERDEKEKEISAKLKKASYRSRGHSPEDHWGGGPFSRRRYGFPRVIPHDTVLHPSKCGGPLVDVDGNVVGINIARALRVTSYAIPADVAQEVVKRLKAKQQK